MIFSGRERGWNKAEKREKSFLTHKIGIFFSCIRFPVFLYKTQFPNNALTHLHPLHSFLFSPEIVIVVFVPQVDISESSLSTCHSVSMHISLLLLLLPSTLPLTVYPLSFHHHHSIFFYLNYYYISFYIRLMQWFWIKDFFLNFCAPEIHIFFLSLFFCK